MFRQNTKNGFVVKGYQGDAKTLLAFNLSKPKSSKLAGFSIACKPGTGDTYYLLNNLHFSDASGHAQDKLEPANSTLNNPIQKFRWVHVPGNYHQNGKPFFGQYTYTVTPRYFDKDDHLLAIDPSLSVQVSIDVKPFAKGKVSLGFTRGFVQSQAFTHHFGNKALFKPKNELVFKTTEKAGTDNNGNAYTFEDEYAWSGFTARQVIYNLIQEVMADKTLSLDVEAYDFNEPVIFTDFIELARQKRIRIILDNASLHHNAKNPKAEDQFETKFRAAFTNKTEADQHIKRGHFARFQHNKVFIVKKGSTPVKVLTGSTNFSITGIYVNSNHVLVFEDSAVAQKYSDAFNEAWQTNLNNGQFSTSPIATGTPTFNGTGMPAMNISYSPHTDSFSFKRLKDISDRVGKEKSSVLFAVMDTDETVKGPISKTLKNLHAKQDVFSYGITDSKSNIFLYKPDSGSGIKVTGLPGQTILPKPFDSEKSISIGHQVHHKFIVCGFNTPGAVVWCGSSNLAQGGEDENGDNLIEIKDQDIATVFAIEAFALVDHFLFRDKFGAKKKNAKSKPLILADDDSWADKYFDKKDMYCQDRELF